MNISRFFIGILLIIPGALMIADAVLMMMGEEAIFFMNLQDKFEFIMGFALIVLGGSTIDEKDAK